MHTFHSFICRVLVTSAAALVISGCSAEAKKSRLTERVERYFKAGEYEKAKIECMNLLREDPRSAFALRHLGLIWAERGVPRNAGSYLLQSRDLDPRNVPLRIKLAQVFLSVGRPAEARKEALAILEQAPASGEALLLLADTSQTAEEIAGTEQRIEGFAQRDTVAFHLASASVAARKGHLAGAESAVLRALKVDPKSYVAHTRMGMIHSFRKKTAEAREELKTAAELSPIRSNERLKYAEFLAQAGEAEAAKGVLQDVTRRAADFLPAWRELAQLAFKEKKYEEALKLVESVFALDFNNFEARILQADVWMAKGEADKAVDSLTQLDSVFPKVPLIKFYLGRAHAQANSPERAIGALNEAIAANPNYPEAIVLLAQVQLRAGQAALAVSFLEELLKKRPELVNAQLLLMDGYRALNRFDDAAALIQNLIKAAPNNAEFHLLLGLLRRHEGKDTEARPAFEKAWELAPDNFVPLQQLIDLDLLNKDFESALQKVERQRQKGPASADVPYLEGKVFFVKGDWDRAEAALSKALDLDPNFSKAYDLLLSTYISAQKLPQAIEQLEAVLLKNPSNPVALLIKGRIHTRRKEFPKARDAFERLLKIKPDAIEALNDLAYVYTEHFNEIAKAHDLARRARTIAPNSPQVADTLGWILYKRGEYKQALSLLQEGATGLPKNPEVQLHLAMAHYMMGETESARTFFRKVIELAGDSPVKEEAQRRIALLGGGAEQSERTFTTEELSALLKQQPEDVIVRLRLAEAFEKQSAFDQAAAAYEQAFKVNPKLLPAATKLAQLNAGPLKNQARAFEFAKKARELAPEDPQVAATLGRVAFQSGNFSWSYSVLHEAARQAPQDAAITRDAAWAAYSIGKVSEARELMQRAVNGLSEESHVTDAKTFLTLTGQDFSASEEIPADVSAEAEKVLERDPVFVPALMVGALSQERRGELPKAVQTYNQVLARFPDFTPAQKQLAALYVEDPAHAVKGYELAVKARKSLPDDPDLARTLAAANYKQKKYDRAVQLYQESARTSPLDAKSLFYLGMSHYHSKRKAECRDALTRARSAGLKEPFASEAERTIAELQKSKVSRAE